MRPTINRRAPVYSDSMGSCIRRSAADAYSRHIVPVPTQDSLPARRIEQRDRMSTRLTRRELECLGWAASGKTAWETSVILDISEYTVVFHIENAKRKLSARTLAHAVAICVAEGLVVVPWRPDESGDADHAT